MDLPLETKSLPIATCTKNFASVKHDKVINWSLYEDLKVVYESHCSEKDSYHKQEMNFDNLPLQIKIMIAKEAVKSPRFKLIDSNQQFKLVLLAVKESTISTWL